MTRFDFTPAAREFFNTLTAANIVDACDIAAAAVTFNGEEKEIVSELMEAVSANMHSDRKKFSTGCKAHDRYHMMRNGIDPDALRGKLMRLLPG